MKKIQSCAACHEQYKRLQFEPFCSQRCEETFHEHAPVDLIDKIYREYAEIEYDQADFSSDV